MASKTSDTARTSNPRAARTVGALLLILAIGFSGFVLVTVWRSAAPGAYTRFDSTASVAGVTEGTISIDAAPDRVTITARDIGADLYQAKIDYVGDAPEFSDEGGHIRISRASNIVSNWGRPRDVIDLTVNPSVAWTITIDAAGTTAQVDLSGAKLRSFKLNGAACNVEMTAGAPAGIVYVSLSGVASGLTVHLPMAADYRVTADGIATGIDGAAQSAGWSTASDRYELSVNGVAAHATVIPIR